MMDDRQTKRLAIPARRPRLDRSPSPPRAQPSRGVTTYPRLPACQGFLGRSTRGRAGARGVRRCRNSAAMCYVVSHSVRAHWASGLGGRYGM